jgi:hypothetical protein
MGTGKQGAALLKVKRIRDSDDENNNLVSPKQQKMHVK